MNASDSILTGNQPHPRATTKRSRFAGERAGAWLFAASFSLGIWGLALKVLSPSHPVPTKPAVPVYAVLSPSGAPDGRAQVLWATEAVESMQDYPIVGGVPVFPLAASDGTTPPAN